MILRAARSSSGHNCEQQEDSEFPGQFHLRKKSGNCCSQKITNPLIEYEARLDSEAELAVPTPDHHLPLLYIAGTRTSSEPVAFPVEGVGGGSVSMLAVQIG